jgi:hypothetical protein
LSIIIIGCIFTSCASKPTNTRKIKSNIAEDEALNLITKYFELETQEKYEGIYSLLSTSRKKQLEKCKVKTPKDYKFFRNESEASWSDFKIEKRTLIEDQMILFEGQAKVEETGEASLVLFKCVVKKEENHWKIDEWKYQEKK